MTGRVEGGVQVGGQIAHSRGLSAMKVEQGQDVVLGQVSGEALPGPRGQKRAEAVHVVKQHALQIHDFFRQLLRVSNFH